MAKRENTNRQSGVLQPGTLWNTMKRTTSRALQSGALQTLHMDFEFVEDDGVRFLVWILPSLEKKRAEKILQKQGETASGRPLNPFLPYDEALFVADISATHVGLLNKFNVIDHHLLIVTRDFEDQEKLLTLQDFEAMWMCMAEFQGLAFYNGGEVAGASQRHKHLQLVPLPFSPREPGFPMEPMLKSADIRNGIRTAPGLPFVHLIRRLNPDMTDSHREAARVTFEGYRDMIKRLGLEAKTEGKPARQPGPYNLFVTREWMFLVPRSCECFESISINTLGFAGSLLVRNDQEMELLKKSGPMTALRSVTFPR